MLEFLFTQNFSHNIEMFYFELTSKFDSGNATVRGKLWNNLWDKRFFTFGNVQFYEPRQK